MKRTRIFKQFMYKKIIQFRIFRAFSAKMEKKEALKLFLTNGQVYVVETVFHNFLVIFTLKKNVIAEECCENKSSYKRL